MPKYKEIAAKVELKPEIILNEDGTVATPDALRSGAVHTLFDSTVPGPAERAHEKAMKELQRQIRNFRTYVPSANNFPSNIHARNRTIFHRCI